MGSEGKSFLFIEKKKKLPLFDLFEHPSKLCYTAISEGNRYEYGKQKIQRFGICRPSTTVHPCTVVDFEF